MTDDRSADAPSPPPDATPAPVGIAGRDRQQRREHRRVMTVAAGTVICGSLPYFLVSAQAVQIREELVFGYVALGGTAAVFNLARAATSVPMGRLADRLGGERGVGLSLAMTTLICLAIAGLTFDYRFLLAMTALAGTAQGLGTSSATLMLSQRLPQRMIGWSVGIQQAGVPGAAVVAGMAVPAVAVTVGWRWSFALAGAITILVALGAGRQRRAVDTTRPRSERPRRDDEHDGSERGPVFLIAVAITFASAASFALTTFVVDYAVTVGFSVPAAGYLLTLAAVLTVAVRVVSGYYASRGQADQLGRVVLLLVLGTLGFPALATDLHGLIVVGTVFAAAFCWSINALVYSTVVQFNRARPGTAIGIALTGTSVGGMMGPLLFGFVVEHVSYPSAWLVAGVLSALSIALMAAGRYRLVRRGRNSPPSARGDGAREDGNA